MSFAEKFSQEYTGAIVIILLSLFKIIGYDIPEAELTSIVASGIIFFSGIYVAYKRYAKGDITMSGKRILKEES